MSRRNPDSPIVLRAGPAALAHIRANGLQPADVGVIPAAAGGPKGLILQGIDQWLFGEWLGSVPRRAPVSVIGASIGAWRMAAACMPDPAAAFRHLGDLYCNQTYPAKPGRALVSGVISALLDNFVAGRQEQVLASEPVRLHILVNRGLGLLDRPDHALREKAGFVAAGLSNGASRRYLARHVQRVLVSDPRDPLPWLGSGFDRFATQVVDLRADNLKPALLASGTLPLIMDPVRDIPGAPAGTYWDGGIIDYHLAFPYSRMAAAGTAPLVLYPHFTDHIVPGWLDKGLAWRRAHRGSERHWLDNVILVSPSAAFIRGLPRQKLPDRKDFVFHGTDHQARISDWQQAIGASQRLRDALAEFIAHPDPNLVLPF